MTERWNRFLRQVQKDARLWLFLTLGLSLYRVVFLVVFRQEFTDQHPASQVLAALGMGLRFDAQIATYAILVPLVGSLLTFRVWSETAAERLRSVWGGAFLVVSILLAVVSIEYYREYHDVFDQMLFHLSDEDTAAIITTVYRGYHLVPYLMLSGVLAWLGLVVRRRYFSGGLIPDRVTARLANSSWGRAGVGLLLLALLVVGLRGSFGRRPLQTRDAGVTDSRMLNKAVLNPHIALFDAVSVFRDVSGRRGIKTYLPDGNVRAALRRAFPGVLAADNLDRYLERTAAGPRIKPPRHIFFLCMESYDAWPMLDKYAGLGLTPYGRRLAREGLQLLPFLPAAPNTIDTSTAILTGLPYASLHARYEPAGRQALPTSLPGTFRRLGYRTRFFCGGFLSWQKIGDFARDQGFDEIYGAAHADPKAPANEWGVPDQYLFDLVEKTVGDDRPSFNYIVSTSYHPPYGLDLKALGVDVPTVPKELEAEFTADRATLLPILGHLRYADRAMGQFVQREEPRVTRPLFVLTGDHWSRRSINADPPLFERSAVPLVLYGKDVLAGVRFPPNCAGSHIDLAPTLIEAVAPRGFQYHAVGQNLLEPRPQFLGFNHRWLIGPDFVIEDKVTLRYGPIPGRPMPKTIPDPPALVRQCRRLQGITWWRLRYGPQLPPDAAIAQRPAATAK